MPRPPKHPSERRNTTKPGGKFSALLPAEGRKGDVPDWPLDPMPNRMETELWDELWATPQAVAWERLGYERIVARYARYLVEVEKPEPSTRLAAEVRQLEDRLGLTPLAMLRLGWEIAPNELGEKKTEKTARRLRAVDASAGG